MIMKGHRLLRADVPSCRSVPFLNSTGYLDGKLIERAGAWHAAWLQKHAGTGTLSRDRDGRAKAECCADRCQHRARCVANELRSTLADHRELAIDHVFSLAKRCEYLRVGMHIVTIQCV